MSISAYKDHPIRASLSRILQMQSEPEFAEPNIAENDQFAFARDKVFAMSHAIDALLHHTPAELTSVQALSQLNSNIQAPLSELTAFLSNKNAGHLINAATQFEQNILPYLWGFVPQLQSLSQDSLSSLLEAQATVSRESVRQLVAQRDHLASKLQELTTKTEEQVVQLGALTEGAAKERAEAAATVAKLEQLFAQKETDRATIFETALTELKKEFKSFEANAKIESDALIDYLENQHVQDL